MGMVARLSCAICMEMGAPDSPAEVHHIGDTADRSDWLVVPLCPEHHRGANGFHGMGERAFNARYKTNEQKLLAETARRLDQNFPRRAA